ncbi:MAG: DUF2017 family protein [Chthoniobacterales bacterium]|jgi:hypothetical protein|nr:DUF2017 family protein [Chthoniobacterales bacterium]
MELFRNNGTLEISEIDPFLAELLRQIPASANPDSVPAAEQRLFSAPADPAVEKEMCAEWKLYVEPELRRIFATATETVEKDLRQLGEDAKPFANRTLRIPLENSEAWLNALNRARLALAAKFDFTEAELCDHYRSPVGSRRDLSLFQVNFYGFLQEFIVRELECSSERIAPNEV